MKVMTGTTGKSFIRRLQILIFVALFLVGCLANAQTPTDQETYETSVLALADGHVQWALKFFDMLLENNPNSRYAPAAIATKMGIYLGHIRANQILLDTLREGVKQAPAETKSSYDSAIVTLESQNADYLTKLEESYSLYTSKYTGTTVSLQLGFPDISGNIEPVSDDLDRLESGTWIPLLISPFQQVRLLYTYSELLVITGVDLSEQPLESWLQGGDIIERLLVKEIFFYQLGSTFAEEGRKVLAQDALQRVISLTQYQPYSELRGKAIELLKEMGIEPDIAEDGSPDESIDVSPQKPSPTGERPSVLFDETRLVTRPTGEKNNQISNLLWYGCSDLGALLRTNGFQIDSLDSGLITYGKLAQYDVFTILSTDHNYPYSLGEALAVASYVEGGGSLLICESTWSGPQRREYTVGALAYMFGVGFIGNGSIKDPEHSKQEGVLPIYDVVSHPVTKGISEFSLIDPAYLNPTGPATVLAYSSEDSWFDDSSLPGTGVKESEEPSGPLPVLATLEFGEGRVVFLADGMLFTNGWLKEGDNGKLALNIFEWLSHQREKEQPTAP